MRLTQQHRADLLGLTTVLLWSTVATAFKLSLRHLTPAQLVLCSSFTAWLFLGTVLAWRRELRPTMVLFKRYTPASLLLGLLNPALYYLILFKAYALLPAQEAQALNYTWALTLSFLAVPLLGHRLRALEVVAGLVCYSGVLVIATRGDVLSMTFHSLPGVLLALGSTLIWALYWILIARDKRPPLASLWMNLCMGTVLLTLYCGFTGDLIKWQRQGLPGALYIGLVEMGVCFILWLMAMKLTRSTARIANLIFLSPLLSLMLINAVLNETILPSTIAGLALILTGLSIQRFLVPEPAAIQPHPHKLSSGLPTVEVEKEENYHHL